MRYNRCGRSGLVLPAVSLGLWHNFGSVDVYDNAKRILHRAFDCGVTHFDLANNYGPVPGSAEETLGKVMREGLGTHRDELVISTKAGYRMWDGPYGDGGSRKYLISSLDQSLKRMGLEYVDIFYHHRPDPETPLEETMAALDHIVRQGKALYVGISNYGAEDARKAFDMLQQMGTPCVIHQAKYSMMERWVENGLLDLVGERGVGLIAFSPLAQGLLTDRYLHGVPQGSRMTRNEFLRPEHLTDKVMATIVGLNEIAAERGESLATMALAWLMKDERLTSVLVGASSVEQLDKNLKAVESRAFTDDELARIEKLLKI